MKYKLAISNIAWTKKEDSAVYELMRNNGFTGLEIAPSRVWDNPYEQTDDNIDKFNKDLENNNLEVVAFQSLLFGHPEFAIFQDESTRVATINHLKNNILLAGKLKAKALIFGSPKNRIIGNLASEKAEEIAISFFRELGEFAVKNRTCFCIEPNPAIYGGDFILSTQEAIELVKKVNSEGFKLNIDLGTITANNEDLEGTLMAALPFAGHIHISEPFLEKIDKNKNKHRKIKEILSNQGYDLALSIEMKNAGEEISNINNVNETLIFISNIYNE